MNDISFQKVKTPKAKAKLKKTRMPKKKSDETIKKAKRRQRAKREKERLKNQKKQERIEKAMQKQQQKELEDVQTRQLKLFHQFLQNVKSDANIACMSVYCYNQDNFSDILKLVGQPLENNIVIERYCSLTSTTIFTNPIGLSENSKFKSRFISSFNINSTCYIICLSSYAFETFKNNNARKIIGYMQTAQRKLGEIN